MNIITNTKELFQDIINYNKYQKILNKVYRETDFIKALNTSFGVQFNIDKIGCLYAVINPYVQNMGETGNNIILDGNGNKIVDRWVLSNFEIIDRVIKNHQLFDILSYDIQQLDDDLNYLLIIQNAMYPFYKKSRFKLRILLGVILTILLIVSLTFL